MTVPLRPAFKRRLWLAPAAVLVLAPGWSGTFVPVTNDDIIAHSQHFRGDDVFGVVRAGEQGEEWHAEYMGSGTANLLSTLGLRSAATSVVPPTFVAHVPPGAPDRPQRADAWFRVEPHVHWPWWRPGGGIRWELPAD